MQRVAVLVLDGPWEIDIEGYAFLGWHRPMTDVLDQRREGIIEPYWD
jgi:hypothetical protein